jgi:hypothetical protein
MTQGNFLQTSLQALGEFDALRILGDEFTVSFDGEEHRFDTPKDDEGRIAFINGFGKNRKVTYSKDSGTACVTYEGNGGEGQAPLPQSFEVGKSVDLAALRHPRELCRLDHTFDGWCTDQSGKGKLYFQGETAHFGSDTTLYAVFTNVFE